jgi:hypothetical protein
MHRHQCKCSAYFSRKYLGNAVNVAYIRHWINSKKSCRGIQSLTALGLQCLGPCVNSFSAQITLSQNHLLHPSIKPHITCDQSASINQATYNMWRESAWFVNRLILIHNNDIYLPKTIEQIFKCHILLPFVSHYGIFLSVISYHNSIIHVSVVSHYNMIKFSQCKGWPRQGSFHFTLLYRDGSIFTF